MLIAKRSARSTRIRSIVQLRHLVFTAPDELRAKLGGLSATQLVNEAARLRPRAGSDVVMHGIKTAAVILARRVQALDAELEAIDIQLTPLVKAAAPGMLNIFGVGVDTAAVLIVAAGDNPERIVSESAWAMICGVAPIPVMSNLPSAAALNQIAVTGLARELPDTQRGCPQNRHAVPSPHTIAGPWPNTSLPSPEWPIAGLPETPATSTLTNIGASISRTLPMKCAIVNQGERPTSDHRNNPPAKASITGITAVPRQLFATRNEIQRHVSAAPLAVSAAPYLLPKQQKVLFGSEFDRPRTLEWA